MEEQTNSMQINEKHSAARYVVVAILIIVIVGIIWIALVRQKSETPQDALKRLEQSSAPVTTTTEERQKELEALDKSSAPVEKSEAERLQELQMLNQ